MPVQHLYKDSRFVPNSWCLKSSAFFWSQIPHMHFLLTLYSCFLSSLCKSREIPQPQSQSTVRFNMFEWLHLIAQLTPVLAILANMFSVSEAPLLALHKSAKVASLSKVGAFPYISCCFKCNIIVDTGWPINKLQLRYQYLINIDKILRKFC